MRNDSYLPVKIVAGIICAYHVWAGLTLILSGEMSIRLAKALAGWTIEGSPAMGIVGEILGCYLIAFGLMMGLVVLDPVRNRSVITVGLALIALRLFQRLYFGAKVIEVFEVTPGRHWAAFAVVAVMGALLALLRQRVFRDAAR